MSSVYEITLIHLSEVINLSLSSKKKKKKRHSFVQNKWRSCDGVNNGQNLYLLLTEFEVLTVCYGPSFFLAQARNALAINRRGKNEDP